MLLGEWCNKGGTELTGFGEIISHPDRSDFNSLSAQPALSSGWKV